MGLNSKLTSFNVLDYWSQELFEDGALGFPKPAAAASQANQELCNKNTVISGNYASNDVNHGQTKKHWPPLRCPRCDSCNTKFCYYNNYNRSQPRHFCKACRRHWTEGGTLRNIPVGGGRKNKRLNKPRVTPTSTTGASSTISAATATITETTTPSIRWPPQLEQQEQYPSIVLAGYRNSSSIISPEAALPQLHLQAPAQPPPYYGSSSNLESSLMIRADRNFGQVKPATVNSFEGIFAHPFPPSLSSHNAGTPYVTYHHHKEGGGPVAGAATMGGGRMVGSSMSTGVASGYWSGWDEDMVSLGCDTHHQA